MCLHVYVHALRFAIVKKNLTVYSDSESLEVAIWDCACIIHV